MANPKASIVLNLTVPLDSTTDPKSIKNGYAQLRKQVAELALALAADPNLIILHTQIHGASVKPAVDPAAATADSHIANLQSINKRIEKGQSVAVDKKFKSKFEASTDEEETPHIVACDVASYKAANTQPATTTPQVDPADEALKKVIFDDMLRKTPRSVAIVDYLVPNRNKVITVSEIAKAINIPNGDVSIWLSTTGQNLKGLTDGGGRGKYLFDSSKIKV